MLIALGVFGSLFSAGGSCAQPANEPGGNLEPGASSLAPNTLGQTPDVPSAVYPLGKTTSRFITLPKLRVKDVENLIDDICTELQLEHGFHRNRSTFSEVVTPVDEAVTYRSVAIGEGESPNLVYFGYLLLPRQSPKLWIFSSVHQPAPNGMDVTATSPLLSSVIAEVFAKTAEYQTHLSFQDLQSDVINLSYVDADGALYALRAMGFSVITSDQGLFQDDSFKGTLIDASAGGANPTGSLALDAAAAGGLVGMPGQTPMAGGGQGGGMGGVTGTSALPTSTKYPSIKQLPTSIDYKRLPMILKMPAADEYSTGLVGAPSPAGSGMGGMGGGGTGGGSGMGGGAMSNASLAGMSTTSPLSTPVTNGANSQLLILSDPNDPSQLYRIRAAIDSIIDKPAKQVFLEALIVELNSDALQQLGVQWTGKKDKNSLTVGALGPIAPGGVGQALEFLRNAASAPTSFTATLNALVSKNMATILSRPSVLTLDNRQALIKVGTDIPIASTTSQFGVANSSFSYQSTGISLNIRPRVSEDNSEISLLIDASVTTVVPGGDVSITNASGAVLGSAPTINSRKVDTYARVPNSTPLILAGLVNDTKSTQLSGVPYLSTIPILGKLFSYERPQTHKTEVIIVLTPTILPETSHAIRVNFPKDSPIYNRMSDELFRNQYRLTEADSLSFYTTERLTQAQHLADLLIKKDGRTAKNNDVLELAYGSIPGEDTLVLSGLHAIVARLKLLQSGRIANSDLLVYERDASGILNKIRLVDVIERFNGHTNLSSFFGNRQILTLTFAVPEAQAKSDHSADVYIPQIKLVDLGNQTKTAFIWQQNAPNDEHRFTHYTVVIQNQEDLDRLKITAMSRHILSLSGGEDALTLSAFTPGHVLSIGSLHIGTPHLIDFDFAHDSVSTIIPDQLFEAEQDSALDIFDATVNTPAFKQILAH
jgi:Flp pilus assembly secretin CpaC